MLEIPDVRIIICGIADYPPGASLGPRLLPDFEIVWIERGDCRWELDGAIHECPAGTVILCRPGSVDKFIWDPTGTTRHGYLHFEFLEEPGEPLPSLRSCRSEDVLRPLLRHATWLAAQGDSTPSDLAPRALQQALCWFVNGHISQSGLVATDNQHPVMLRALHDLQRRWGDGPRVPPTIAEWSTAIGVSRGHLARVCNQQFGDRKSTRLNSSH